MDNQKIENQLNLAIDATPVEREKSMNLEVGFDWATATWQVIVKFYGTETELREVFFGAFPNQSESIKIQDLIGKYAILEIPESLVEQVAALPEIEYMEKPKRLFFAVNSGRSASCINPLQTSRNNLTGRGVIVAIVDSGIDYAHPDFRKELEQAMPL